MARITLEIPLDLVDTVISALYRSADWYRADKGHDAEGIAVLIADADRLETMAERLEADARRERGEGQGGWSRFLNDGYGSYVIADNHEERD